MFVETKEAGEVQQAPAKVLKLSEAIRIGSKKREQCAGAMWSRGRSCAMGAAYEGLAGDYGRTPNDAYVFIEDTLGVPAAITREVITRNDMRRETREEIADWVEAQGY